MSVDVAAAPAAGEVLPAGPVQAPRRRRRRDTAAVVRRARERHPGESVAALARRVGVSARTVRRHLSVLDTGSDVTAPVVSASVSGGVSAGEGDMVPDVSSVTAGMSGSVAVSGPVSAGVSLSGGDGSADMTPDTVGSVVSASVSAGRARPVAAWPLLLLALPAAVAIWSGWVGLGEMAGFGPVHPLPGIWDGLTIDSAITLPVGVEAYAAYALRAWLAAGVPVAARRFARRSAIGSLIVGAAGQVAYHLLTAAGVGTAPWWITTMVACLPVAVLGMGCALAHLIHEGQEPAAPAGMN